MDLIAAVWNTRKSAGVPRENPRSTGRTADHRQKGRTFTLKFYQRLRFKSRRSETEGFKGTGSENQVLDVRSSEESSRDRKIQGALKPDGPVQNILVSL